MTGDTALVLVIFKKSGVAFSQNIQKITGTVSTYSLGVMSFTLAQTPDTVMFAALSSNAISGSFPGIVGSMLQVDSVDFTGVSSQPANFNGDFETWTTFSTNPNLTGWYMENSSINNQTTDKFAGTYALELKSTQLNNTNDSVNSSQASTGYYVSGPESGGYPYTHTVDTLKFNYKYIPGGSSNDSASVQLAFKKAGVTFALQYMSLKAAASYTQAVISYSLTQIPDTIIVNINSSKRYRLPISYLGSDLKIDNMYLASQASPVTNFTLQPSACVGAPVQLTDMSSNIPTTWTWTTTGGNSSGANTQNPTVTYTTNGTYTVTLNTGNAGGSGTPVSHTITINPLPSVTVSPSSFTLCAGTADVLTANVTGGLAPMSYTWHPAGTAPSASVTTITPSATTATSVKKWFVVVTDANGCTTSNDTIQVHINSLPQVATLASTTLTCAGSPVTLTAVPVSGGLAPLSYTWHPGGTAPSATVTTITPSATTATSVKKWFMTVQDANGCMFTNDTVAIQVNALPTLTITPSTTTLCIGSTATLTASGASTYTWNTSATGTTITPSPTVTITYTVTGMDANGCMNMDTQLITVNTCGTGIEANTATSSISLFPNPNNGSFTIKGNTELSDLHIINELGQVMQTLSLKQATNYEVNLTGLDKGVYYLIGNTTKQRIVVIN
jgi:PKD repeat protein